VDLAQLSMSGSLYPCIPTQFYVKYQPPRIAIRYHFANNKAEEFYHEIDIERRAVEQQSAKEVTTQLFVQEPYYFNPKVVKRNQVGYG